FLVPARKLHPSAKLALDQLALVETLAIGCHAVNRGAPRRGEHVLVVGAGPIGLSGIEFVKLTGATLTVLDLHQPRRDLCDRRMGLDDVVRSQGADADLRAMHDLTGGALPSLVFDATGNTPSMCRSFHYVSHTGRLVFVGIVTDEVRFPDPLFHRREMTVFASR